MKEICIIIPTSNRSCSIDNYIFKNIDALQKLSIDLIIFDSSSDDKTEQVVKNYINSGITGIRFFHYENPQGQFAIDQKVFDICKELQDQYHYYWFSGDQTILQLDANMKIIKPCLQEEYDLLVVNDKDYLNCREKEYLSLPVEFCQENCWRMTMLCTVICGNQLLKTIVKEYSFSEDKFFGFWLPMAYFYAISVHSFKAKYIVINGFYSVNPSAPGSSWATSGNAFWQWGKIWTQAVMSLPDCYNEVKKEIIKSHDENMQIFAVPSLLVLKRYGNLSLKKIAKYKKYIPMVTNTSVCKFYAVSIGINKITTKLPNFDRKWCRFVEKFLP